MASDSTRVVRSSSRGDSTSSRGPAGPSEINVSIPLDAQNVPGHGLSDPEEAIGSEKQALLAFDEAGGSIPSPGANGSPMKAKKREKRVRRRSRTLEESRQSPIMQDFHARVHSLWGGSKHAGVLLVVASSGCQSLMGLLAKLLQVHEVPPFETLMIRCALMAVFSGVGLKRGGVPFQGRGEKKEAYLLARALAGFMAVTGFFYTIQALDVPDAMALYFLTPLVAACFAQFFLQETPGAWDIIGALVGYLGVLLLTQPPLLMGHAVKGWEALQLPAHRQYWLAGTSKVRERRDAWTETVAIIISAFAILCGAAALCLVRAIVRTPQGASRGDLTPGSQTGESPLVPVFASAIVAAPLAGLTTALLRQFVVPSPGEFLGMVLVAGLAFLSQVCLARALQLERVARIMPIMFTRSLFTQFAAVLFLSNSPSLLGALGGFLVLGSAAVVALLGGDKREPVEMDRM